MLRNVPSRSRHLRRNVTNRACNVIVCRGVFASGARPTKSLMVFNQHKTFQTTFHTRTASPIGFADDTIYALSTAHGRAGIAIIRISGSACLDV